MEIYSVNQTWKFLMLFKNQINMYWYQEQNKFNLTKFVIF